MRMSDGSSYVCSSVLQQVARPNPRAVVPPFLAAENQVRAGNLADAGRLTAVSEVQRNRPRLRRDQAAEFRFARKRLIPVDRIGIVHRHYPATDIARRARVPELTRSEERREGKSVSYV